MAKDFTVKLCRLSRQFYNDYPHNKCQEILTKPERPYTCLCIDTKEGYSICIPFRSQTYFRYSFRFTDSKRSKRTESGLDYRKVVLVKNDAYFEKNERIVVDRDEYAEVLKNIDKIVKEVNEYIDTYIAHVTGENVLSDYEYNKRYMVTTLQYFHNILGIGSQEQSQDKKEAPKAEEAIEAEEVKNEVVENEEPTVALEEETDDEEFDAEIVFETQDPFSQGLT